MLMNPPAEDLRHIRAEARADLVRRLLAVAISIGVAATLTKMSWVQSGRLPDPLELNQTIALGTALAATILSWDGPLLAMPQRPLFGFGRFLVDVALVFVYMFLLIGALHPGCMLWTLAVIFLVYILRDVLTIREHAEGYDRALAGAARASPTQIWHVYAGGFARRSEVEPRPVVTLIWATYFLLLAFIASPHADAHVRTSCVFALIGVVGYWLDEAGQQRSESDGGMRWRSIIVLSALIAAAIYFRLLPGR
jgi:hypothetical protein